MIALGVDWGRVRVGLAISDELGMLAHPLPVFPGESVNRVVEEIVRLARDRSAERVVLGLPRNMDGSEGGSAREVRRLAERLEKAGVSVVLWDERLTSWEADRILTREGNRPAARRKESRDAVAACLILQSYLDAQKK